MTAKTKTAKQTPSNKGRKTPPAAKGKTPKKPASSKASRATKLSAIAAAARVLSETGRAMTCPELIEEMAAKRYWTSPGGKTPASTLYTVVTMLPNLAPHGATVKRARTDPVGDSDLFGLNLDAFHQAANDFASCVPLDVIESVADLVGKRV